MLNNDLYCFDSEIKHFGNAQGDSEIFSRTRFALGNRGESLTQWLCKLLLLVKSESTV